MPICLIGLISPISPMSNIYWESFKTFFNIGIFTLGGGYAMIPLIEAEVVDKHRWVSVTVAS